MGTVVQWHNYYVCIHAINIQTTNAHTFKYFKGKYLDTWTCPKKTGKTPSVSVWTEIFCSQIWGLRSTQCHMRAEIHTMQYEGWDPHNAFRQLQYMVLDYLGTKYLYLPSQYFQIFTLDVFECMCICCLDVDCMIYSWYWYPRTIVPMGHIAYVRLYLRMYVYFFDTFMFMVNKKQIFTNSGKIKFAPIGYILRHLVSKCFMHLESLSFSH